VTPPVRAGVREPPREAEHFRPDIEGLRGLAILMVVMFHAVPGLLGGGYIGVDVFFVISGFLITGLLVRELGRSGQRPTNLRQARPSLTAALAIGATFP
jgi:peptidoglycan/LPS O-acetylase OafA/YrhL